LSRLERYLLGSFAERRGDGIRITLLSRSAGKADFAGVRREVGDAHGEKYPGLPLLVRRQENEHGGRASALAGVGPERPGGLAGIEPDRGQDRRSVRKLSWQRGHSLTNKLESHLGRIAGMGVLP
jgi:hypothetical protein